MTLDEWFDKYKPIDNASGEKHGGGIGDRDKILHAFCGEDLDAVRAADPNTVWTLLDADGIWIIGSGFHRVNRIGYLITEIPCDDDILDVYYDEEEREVGCEA